MSQNIIYFDFFCFTTCKCKDYSQLVYPIETGSSLDLAHGWQFEDLQNREKTNYQVVSGTEEKNGIVVPGLVMEVKIKKQNGDIQIVNESGIKLI